MRATPTGHPCGSPPNPACGAPADACGPGWGLCLGHTAVGLDTATFVDHVSPAECASPVGGYLGAMSHAPLGATACPSPANHSLDNGCNPRKAYGSEPLCCGSACHIPSCSTALWANSTRALFGAEAAGPCGAVQIRADGEPRGVLCCKIGATTKTPTTRPVSRADRVPPLTALDETGPGLLTWNGGTLHGGPGAHGSMAQILPQPADLSQWNGGLAGGPLVFFDGAAALDVPLTATVLGPSSQFNTAIVSRVGNRMVGGVQGMVVAIEANYSLRFALVGRSNGVTSGIMAYGAFLKQSHGTAAAKLRLPADPLSRQLHYVTDGGSLLNYCDYWPKCTASHCVPMGQTLQAAHKYHRALGLNVSVYHVDPYWCVADLPSSDFSNPGCICGALPVELTKRCMKGYLEIFFKLVMIELAFRFSHNPLGGCEDGPAATNLSASPFHFPDGLAALGVPMMLFVQSFTVNNVYAKEYTFLGQSVSGDDSARFFADRFAEFSSGGSTCSALTLDGLQGVFRSHPSRLTSTSLQARYDPVVMMWG